MDTTSNKFKVRLGIFILTGLVILVGIVFYIGKQKNLFNSTFRTHAIYKDIGGIEVGNHVRFSGINVGVVDNIRILTDTSVQVDMLLQQEVRKFIKQDATASIGSEGLMGDKVISLSQGTYNTAPVKEGFRFNTTEPVEMEQLIASFQNTGQNAEVATDQLAEILYKINNGSGTLSKLIGDSSFANNISQTVVNLRKGSNNLNQNMEAAKSSFLLKGYFKKKKKKEQEKQDKIDKAKEEDKK